MIRKTTTRPDPVKDSKEAVEADMKKFTKYVKSAQRYFSKHMTSSHDDYFQKINRSASMNYHKLLKADIANRHSASE